MSKEQFRTRVTTTVPFAVPLDLRELCMFSRLLVGFLWIKGLTSTPSRVYNHDTGTELQVINDSRSNNMNDTQPSGVRFAYLWYMFYSKES